MAQGVVILCREVDKEGLRPIVIYEIKRFNEPTEEFSRLVFALGIRARANPELRYFAVQTDFYTEHKEFAENSIRRGNRSLCEYYPIKEL